MTKYTYDVDSFSDLHKDAYGFRPRGEAFYNWLETATPAQLQAEWDRLVEMVVESIRHEEERQGEAIVELQKEITWMLHNGADSVTTCVRWLHEAYTTGGDNMYLDYHLGVKYGTIDRLLEIQEMEAIAA